MMRCLHCGREPEPGIGHDAIRFICSTCVDAAVRPNGRSLKFPRDEQDEMFLSSIAQPSTLSAQPA